MNLSNRFKAELLLRLIQQLPQPTQWEVDQLSCSFEKLIFANANAIEETWAQTAVLEGRLNVELLMAGIPDMNTEPAIDDLLNNGIILLPDESINTGELSEHARFIFREWNNTTANVQGEDIQIVVIHFDVQGSLVRKTAIESVPDIYLSQAPEIGLAHEASYISIDEYIQE